MKCRAAAPTAVGPHLVAVAVSLAVWRADAAPVIAIATVAALSAVVLGVRLQSAALLLAVVVTAAFAADVRSDAAAAGLQAPPAASFTGWVTVADDPRPYGSGVRVVLDVDGTRAEVWIHGRAARLRVGTWNQGDLVWVRGEVGPLDAERARRVAWEHISAEFDAEVLGNRRAGAPLDRATNRVRGVLAAGTERLGPVQGPLAAGLIYGDDRQQPPAMLERFRASGLTHVSAVSGQNVAFVVAAAGPLLMRWRTGWRLAGTLAVIGWFVLLTRAEPSVLRAGAMAGLSSVAFALGRDRDPPRLLSLSVAALLLLDPLLFGSIGFWMSVGATAGVILLGPPLGRRLVVLGPLALPLGTTLGAQIGVAIPSTAAFGLLSVTGTLANLLAVPVAGLVMLYGMPAALVAGTISERAPPIASAVIAPAGIGTRWIDAVAAFGAGIQLTGTANVVGWAVVLAALAVVALWWRRDTGMRG